MSDRSTWHKKGFVELSRDEFPEWAAERLQIHESLIAMLAAKATAMQYGLAMIIGDHPDPGTLLAKWHAAMPDLVDAEMAGDLYETEDYRESFQRTLAFLTRTMEAASGQESREG